MSYEEIYNYIVLDLNSADTDKSIDNSFFAQMLDAQDIKGFVETGNYQDFTDTAFIYVYALFCKASVR